MTEVTNILSRIEQGDPVAAEELLPLVYDELRKLATARMAAERGDHTLQATALVHEAYVRLVDTDRVQNWDSRGHFFSAAAEAMRRILVERARRHRSQKRGGDLQRIDIDAVDLADRIAPDQLLALDELIDRLSREDPEAAQIVKLRYFAGCSVEQAAKAIEMSTATAYRHWTYARAWLHGELLGSDD
jgi:RNA polymerase sigma factor (TIGR02999 family)